MLWWGLRVLQTVYIQPISCQLMQGSVAVLGLCIIISVYNSVFFSHNLIFVSQSARVPVQQKFRPLLIFKPITTQLYKFNIRAVLWLVKRVRISIVGRKERRKEEVLCLTFSPLFSLTLFLSYQSTFCVERKSLL